MSAEEVVELLRRALLLYHSGEPPSPTTTLGAGRWTQAKQALLAADRWLDSLDDEATGSL